MKYIIALLITFNTFASLKTVKKRHESKLRKIRAEYLHELNAEKQTQLRHGGTITAIEAEISRITILLNPIAEKYRIVYTTGVRHYRIKNGMVYFDSQGSAVPYTRKGNIIVFKWANGSVEAWERSGNGWIVGYTTAKGQLITGKAKKE